MLASLIGLGLRTQPELGEHTHAPMLFQLWENQGLQQGLGPLGWGRGLLLRGANGAAEKGSNS